MPRDDAARAEYARRGTRCASDLTAMIGAEARASGFNVMLAGGINLMRDPRNGRTFEYLGEDPLHSGLLGGAAVRGIQSNHVISTLKHFAINPQETGRAFMKTDAGVSHGNSGGAAIDSEGRLIGVPTAYRRITEATATRLVSAGKVGLVRPIEYARDLIAQARRHLVIKRGSGLLHGPGELLVDFLAPALEHLDRGGDIARVLLLRDQPDAGRRATLDLVLQARTAAILEERVLAVAQLEELLQLQQRFARRTCARVRAEQAAGAHAWSPVEREPREGGLGRDVDVRKALVITQHHVEARLVLLDEVVLEE